MGLSGGSPELMPDDDYSPVLTLAQRGTSLIQQYESSGILGDLEGGIDALRDANEFLPEDHPRKAGCLNNLGNSFLHRFQRLGNLVDLDEAIMAQQQAVRLTPDGHPDKPPCLNNLGNSFRRRFERLGNLVDLNEAITAQQQAVRLTPDGHPDKPPCLSSLGISFRRRFERLGNLVDLDEAITAQQQAVRLTPDGHPEMPPCLGNLGNSFLGRFQRLGNLVDLGEAITAQQQAVRLTPDGHPDKPGRLNNLGISFRLRFERLGNLDDLDEAIMAQQQAVRLTLDGHPDKPPCLNNLGNSFLRRFERLGSLVNLDEAITAQQQAVRLTPDGHPDKPGRLNNLGNSFLHRFERLGNLVDVDEAITAQQQAVRLTPDGHPDKPRRLNNLGNSFLRRFECLGNLVNLDEAIAAQQQAVRLTPDGHPDMPPCLSNLGNSFLRRFERLGNLGDLDEAITAQQQAVCLTPDGHPDKPGCLNNLGISFRLRFERLGNLDDLDEAITAQQQAVRLTPDGHPNKPQCLNNLGTSFHTRLERWPDNATFAQTTSIYSQSATSSSGRPSDRFVAAKIWASLCFSIKSSEALDAYSTLVTLLPRLVWLGATIEQRYRDISGIGNAMANAVNAAIHFGKFDLALEWMEQGRSIVWGQMLQLRTPLEDLRQHYPNDANELDKISRALESAGVASPGNSFQLIDHNPQPLEAAAQAHRRLAEQYDHVLARIRNLPRFSDFLQPAHLTSLCKAATAGPVIIVHAHGSRCDALVLRPHLEHVSHLPLPGLQLSVAQDMQHQLVELVRGRGIIARHFMLDGETDKGPWASLELSRLSDLLGRLWLSIVEPILTYLKVCFSYNSSCFSYQLHGKVLEKPADNAMPHITWCLAGPLTFLPIHAAGLYDGEDGPKIFDYVVSSYTPTLASLLSIQHRPNSSSTTQLLAVSQQATPALRPLPGTVKEVNAIQALQTLTDRLHVTRLDHQDAMAAAVIECMKECNWIHLACHGIQDVNTPIDSAFLLFDGRLTLKQIMKESFSHTELAFLSACQTAKGDSELPEEAIHLAAGMLMAGYGSVVATMWSIGDEDAPIVAEQFYKYLIKEADGDSGRAAYALHNAAACLRKDRGEKNFASWVPFIHLGICSLPLSA